MSIKEARKLKVGDRLICKNIFDYFWMKFRLRGLGYELVTNRRLMNIIITGINKEYSNS